MTRKTGGGAAPPRQRAFGGQTNAPNMSKIMTTTQQKPLFERPEVVEVPAQEDTNVIVPGSLIRPILVSGHKYTIAAMCLSRSGKYLVTGTQAPTGASAEIIIWDVAEKKPIHVQKQHKGSITDIAIAQDDSFFATLGEDNALIAYPISEKFKHPLYTPLAGRQFISTKPMSAMLAVDEKTVVVGGDDYLDFITVDLTARTLTDTAVKIPLKRRINCFQLIDNYVYAGTEQGDVLKIDPKNLQVIANCPQKSTFVGAVTSIAQNAQGNLICSTNAGNVYLIRTDTMQAVQKNEIQSNTGAASSSSTTSALQLSAAAMSSNSPLARIVSCNTTGISCLAACDNCDYVYAIGPNSLARINRESLEVRLLQTSPPTIVSPSGIMSVTSPADTARVFVTACGSFISVWSSQTGVELLRISVPNTFCTAVTLSPDGAQIISGWSDGCLRSFAPQTGRAVFCMQNVHQGGITALALSADGAFAFTGGADFKICLVDVCQQKLLQVCSGHRGQVNSVTVQQVGSQQLLTTACQAGFVQNFFVIQNGANCELKTAWSSRAEGNLLGAVQLSDGSQVLAVGSGGLSWFQCGKNGGSIARALPLCAAGTSVCKEEKGDKCRVAVGTNDGLILVLDWDTGVVLRKLHVFSGAVNAIWSVAGKVIAGGIDGGIVVFGLWD